MWRICVCFEPLQFTFYRCVFFNEVGAWLAALQELFTLYLYGFTMSLLRYPWEMLNLQFQAISINKTILKLCTSLEIVYLKSLIFKWFALVGKVGDWRIFQRWQINEKWNVYRHTLHLLFEICLDHKASFSEISSWWKLATSALFMNASGTTQPREKLKSQYQIFSDR